MSDEPWHKRVPYPDHPDRCQSVGAGGNQCLFFSEVPGTGRCRMHGGNSIAKRLEKEAVSQYNLAKYQARVSKFGSHEGVFRLRDEIGILRMTLESTLNGFQSDNDLVMGAHKVAHLVSQIRDTLKVGKALESAIGDLMDRATIQRLCDAIVLEVEKVVPPEALPKFVDAIAAAIANAVSKVEEKE